MLLKVGSGGVPIGNYTATFIGIKEQAANEKGYGPGVRWEFKITAGPQAGQVVSRITGPSPTPKNGAGKMLAGILGRALKEGEEVDLQTYIGRPYMVVVAAGQQGGTRVEAIVPMPQS
jgi:hypothetical protein